MDIDTYSAHFHKAIENADKSNKYCVFPLTVVNMYKIRKCYVCNASYREIDSLGRWQCSYHPGSYTNGKYLCCGAIRRDVMGCKQCDHSEVRFKPSPTATMSSCIKMYNEDWIQSVFSEYGDVDMQYKYQSIVETGVVHTESVAACDEEEGLMQIENLHTKRDATYIVVLRYEDWFIFQPKEYKLIMYNELY